MKIIEVHGKEEIALVYLAETGEQKYIEFAESVQPPLPLHEKWVLLISTLYGCPVKCLMCDAGYRYAGKLTHTDILGQIDFLIRRRFPDGVVPVKKFKIQFARMGEPAFNAHVLRVLEELPGRYHARGLIPALSTIAPRGCETFFQELLKIKKRVYRERPFQLQFSLHTTDRELRNRLMPVEKWDFEEIATFGRNFHERGGRKITLNFAAAKGFPIDAHSLLHYFDPEVFLLKLTPLNPTYRVMENNLVSSVDPWRHENNDELVDPLESAGYTVLLSIGEPEENYIGSNCGQYVAKHLSADEKLENGYTYVKMTTPGSER